VTNRTTGGSPDNKGWGEASNSEKSGGVGEKKKSLKIFDGRKQGGGGTTGGERENLKRVP